jgi:hypothetical protein
MIELAHVRAQIGQNALELILRILKHVEKSHTVTFIQFETRQSFAERAGKPNERLRVLVESSSKGEAREVWLPDHDVVFARRLIEQTEMTKLVAAAVQHDELKAHEIRTTFTRDQLSVSTLSGLLAQRPELALAVSSRVTTSSGEELHLPLMDFQCPISDANLRVVVAALNAVNRGTGAVVETDRSYHYYGFDLLSRDEWHRFLCKCLLLLPITDTRYIAHCLLDRECVLRLAPSPSKSVQPRVVRLLGSAAAVET